LDENPYSAPQQQPHAAVSSPIRLWQWAGGPAVLLVVFGSAAIAAFIPAGHVFLFSAAVIALVACTAFALRGVFSGKKIRSRPATTPEPASREFDPVTEKRIRRVVFITGVLGGLAPAALLADVAIESLQFFQVPLPAVVYWASMFAFTSLTAYFWQKLFMWMR
jgi:hypothetical protein